MQQIASPPRTGRLSYQNAIAIALVCLGCIVTSVPAKATEAENEAIFQKKLAPLLRTYCYDCHGESDGEGDLSLAADDSAEKLIQNRGHWMRCLTQIRLGTMPPADADPMPASIRSEMADLIEQLANAVDCVQNPNAGKVALRRLNRAEYRNTIRDLTGVDYAPAEDFPGDDVGYGFDTIGDVLSLPPLLMEKYLDAAESIMGQAIHTPPPPLIFHTQEDPLKLIGAAKWNGKNELTIFSNGTVGLEIDAPFAGNYTVTIVASGTQGGDEPVRAEIRVGKNKKVVEIPETEPTEKAASFQLGRGKRKIEIAFINDAYVAKKYDRNLILHHVEVRGIESERVATTLPDLPASHRVLLFQTPSRDRSFEQAATAVLSRFASRGYRRPVTQYEVSRLVELADSVRSGGGSFEESMQVAMQAVLVSPYFLFRIERPRKPSADGAMPLVSEYELATRISYFLWSSMPDDELLLLAYRDQLRDRTKLFDKVGRMILDARASRFVENFAAQWLQLRNLDNVSPDTRIYRGFDDEIRQAMRTETLMFFSEVMKKSMPIPTLLDADFSYMNEPLAKFYGIDGVRGDEFRRVSLSGTSRGGLLTHASVLTVTSNPTRTSPVKRGKWILDNLLNMPPPPAPPNVPELEKSILAGSLRERMEQHRADPACAACHNMMDPLGFALENFDAVGRYRTRDGKDEIDASGEMPDGTTFRGAEGLRELLANQRKDQFVRCLAEKMLIYALGRGTEYYDKCAIDEIMNTVRAKDYRFAYLIAAIIESDPFQKQGSRE
ncbi:DUF1592 domain-containing protein [Aporhodopirellula aestuarii]|uniref:DUF1592 domain-containing protein n=1 Tax=Aporhodopirellula aestuarii TaxID=2950107 RepID=A0ABT0TZH9_9BACT|nr:DUF1592 domain-containing protein [Aporhodopirellula aestuarii]MCM2370003.1 DUF1592 domain-containing protein [Aporhodopirellula aestuarii]